MTDDESHIAQTVSLVRHVLSRLRETSLPEGSVQSLSSIDQSSAVASDLLSTLSSSASRTPQSQPPFTSDSDDSSSLFSLFPFSAGAFESSVGGSPGKLDEREKSGGEGIVRRKKEKEEEASVINALVDTAVALVEERLEANKRARHLLLSTLNNAGNESLQRTESRDDYLNIEEDVAELEI